MKRSIWFRIACLLVADAAALATPRPALANPIDDAAALYPVTIDPTVLHEDAKLTGYGPVGGAFFGKSVALSGDTALVGAPGDVILGPVEVFVRSGATWSRQAVLHPGGSAGDWQGVAVALSGDTALVGAPYDDHAGGTDAGSVYVFTRSGTTWTQQDKLTASDASVQDLFGTSVALSGDTAVVGAPGDEHPGGPRTGSAYVFTRSGTTWTQQDKLTANEANEFEGFLPIYFGTSVALSGDTVVVGAPSSSFSSAWVFTRSGTTWSEQARLPASDFGPSEFGTSVVLSGDTAMVGAPGDDHESGSAYVFVRIGTTWSEQARLTASDAEWNDEFGWSVASSGDVAVVGARYDDQPGQLDAGSAYVFTRSGTTWLESAQLTASDAANSDFFGTSVALSGGTALVGCPNDDHTERTNAGSAYVFPFNQPVALCQDVTVPAGPDCTADASIDAGSFDPNGDPITLEQSPPRPYGGGTTQVTLIVTDDQGNSDSCTATVTVEDTTPPELSVELTPDTLWPPNHRLIDVEASVVATDTCSTVTVLTLVASNENDNDDGDGNTDNDIQDTESGTSDFNFKLRAERARDGGGRVYSAIYTVTDVGGNAASIAGIAMVPHDQGGVTEPLEILVGENGGGTLIWWNEVPGAQSYDVIRGQLVDIVETDVEFSLGPVTCIESNSTDESTAGWADPDLPNPGQGFFYLAQYDFDDGTGSSYGTESADKPRTPESGDCQQ